MAELLPDELTPRQTERAIRTFLRGNALFLAPGHCKRTVLYTGMRLAGAYHGLHGMIVNYEPNPKCTESNLVLQRLFDEAVPQAVTLITEYLPCIRGGAAVERPLRLHVRRSAHLVPREHNGQQHLEVLGGIDRVGASRRA